LSPDYLSPDYLPFSNLSPDKLPPRLLVVVQLVPRQLVAHGKLSLVLKLPLDGPCRADVFLLLLKAVGAARAA
jgi:hypothetical protein